MAPLHKHSAPPNEPSTGTDGDAFAAQDDVAPATHRARRRRISPPQSRVAFSVGIALVCTMAAAELLTGGPTAATASTQAQSSVAVADALGIDGGGLEAPVTENPELLGQLAASRSERDAEQAAAVAAQTQAEQAAVAAKAQAEAEAKAAAEAAVAAEAAAAAQAAEAQAPAAPAASVAASVLARINNSSGPIKAVAQNAANAVISNVPGADGITIGGTRASAADPGGHPSGLALDYMTSSSLGDAIAEYHIAHWDELGVEYIIWRQRMLSSPGGSWKTMENRGSPTANHMDHVHVNYRG